ncbi:MAG: hypothetical protein QXY45_01950 [Candidatus Aenigmatarchaeota archaeon]
MKKGLPILILTLISFGLAKSIVLDYYIISEMNGNSLIIIKITGSGLVRIPLQEDVPDVEVRGGLYTIENNILDVAIGSTEEAVVTYKTSMLTEKIGDTWKFNLNLTSYPKNKVILALPNETIIKNTNPKAFVESGNFKKIVWEGDLEEIYVEYKFENKISENKEEKTNYTAPFIISFLVIVSGIFLIYSFRKRVKKESKENIIKTLPDNESKIVRILLENGGEIKRSRLEKISGIPKSSLAISLKNLEKKNIIQLDKTYKSHYVKVTEWFDEV